MALSFPRLLWLPYSAFILKAFSSSQSPLAEEMERKRMKRISRVKAKWWYRIGEDTVVGVETG